MNRPIFIVPVYQQRQLTQLWTDFRDGTRSYVRYDLVDD